MKVVCAACAAGGAENILRMVEIKGDRDVVSHGLCVPCALMIQHEDAKNSEFLRIVLRRLAPQPTT
jgi:hypothetical protein